MKNALLLIASIAALTACAGNRPPETPRRQAITPPSAQRLATYSTAVRSGNLYFFSGVIGTRDGERQLTTTGEQTHQVLQTIRGHLANVGLTPHDLVKCTVFLVDMRDYSEMNEVYAKFFEGGAPPARSAIGVAALPAGARVEIECIAAAR